ncbi:hypothetical protein [Actinoallomurus rhizosphaericola]|uniref:hypothetical protein n=1 Tax=Actinoallomurus rhizosphaericola TaxID=2952536 RepID=UPI0020934CF0|nr:hypothetical protein [Actinoallomurus rhizosphaericola]MCO5996685.1 hypothetical protein [Actinoallomurus rhizosphaericola]
MNDLLGVKGGSVSVSAILSTAISTGGVVLAGLGGVALTHRGTLRREAEQAERARRELQEQTRKNDHGELVGAATRLRVLIEVAYQRHWPDMDGRILAIQDQAIAVGVAASKVALGASAAEGDRARALGLAASQLAAYVARHTEMGRGNAENGVMSSGQITRAPGFTEFDARLDEFYAVAGMVPPDIGVRRAPRYRLWLTRRSASSR